jgi:WD40 repeat protein
MSARRVEGAMGRPELFQAVGSEAAASKYQVPAPYEGESKDDDEPLQLEHMMGYSGRHTCTVAALPNDEIRFVKTMGNLVCIENLEDPHDQKLMRGHDMPISALAVSPSGNFIASGQEGTTKFKGLAAPIFVWDSATGSKLITLKGLSVKVTRISFSQDERFVSGTGSVGIFDSH